MAVFATPGAHLFAACRDKENVTLWNPGAEHSLHQKWKGAVAGGEALSAFWRLER